MYQMPRWTRRRISDRLGGRAPVVPRQPDRHPDHPPRPISGLGKPNSQTTEFRRYPQVSSVAPRSPNHQTSCPVQTPVPYPLRQEYLSLRQLCASGLVVFIAVIAVSPVAQRTEYACTGRPRRPGRAGATGRRQRRTFAMRVSAIPP